MISIHKVEGKDHGDIVLYALSTCVWCKRTKHLLDELGVAYRYIYIDLENEEDQAAIEKDLERFDADVTYPTMIINDDMCIKGFDMFAIRGALE
ncbi:MAG: glutaredoxin family protein [Eubacteriales bacterium]